VTQALDKFLLDIHWHLMLLFGATCLLSCRKPETDDTPRKAMKTSLSIIGFQEKWLLANKMDKYYILNSHKRISIMFEISLMTLWWNYWGYHGKRKNGPKAEIFKIITLGIC